MTLKFVARSSRYGPLLKTPFFLFFFDRLCLRHLSICIILSLLNPVLVYGTKGIVPNVQHLKETVLRATKGNKDVKDLPLRGHNASVTPWMAPNNASLLLATFDL